MKAPYAKKLTRRRFLKATSTAFVGGAVLGVLPLDGTASSLSGAPDDWPQVNPEKQKQRLLSGWDHHRGTLGGIWEVWRKSANDVNLWPPVKLPHCFNASDAVDPDVAYYQGPGEQRPRGQAPLPDLEVGLLVDSRRGSRSYQVTRTNTQATKSLRLGRGLAPAAGS